MIAGLFHDPKKGRPPSPADFDPYARRRKKTRRKGRNADVPKAGIDILKAVFVDGRR